jgi:uncharacterized protein (TIGR02266 family)
LQPVAGRLPHISHILDIFIVLSFKGVRWSKKWGIYNSAVGLLQGLLEDSMKKETLQDEHRKTSRKSTIIQVNYNTVDSFFREFADNISAGGMFIATPKPLEPGTQLSLEFLLPGCDYPIRVKAEVTWNQDKTSNDQRRGMGVKFGSLSPSAKDKINTVVKQLRSVP